jgi:hypothetical protein
MLDAMDVSSTEAELLLAVGEDYLFGSIDVLQPLGDLICSVIVRYLKDRLIASIL